MFYNLPLQVSIYLFDTLVSIIIRGDVPINFNLCEIYNHFFGSICIW